MKGTVTKKIVCTATGVLALALSFTLVGLFSASALAEDNSSAPVLAAGQFWTDKIRTESMYDNQMLREVSVEVNKIKDGKIEGIYTFEGEGALPFMVSLIGGKFELKDAKNVQVQFELLPDGRLYFIKQTWQNYGGSGRHPRPTSGYLSLSSKK